MNSLLGRLMQIGRGPSISRRTVGWQSEHPNSGAAPETAKSRTRGRITTTAHFRRSTSPKHWHAKERVSDATDRCPGSATVKENQSRRCDKSGLTPVLALQTPAVATVLLSQLRFSEKTRRQEKRRQPIMGLFYFWLAERLKRLKYCVHLQKTRPNSLKLFSSLRPSLALSLDSFPSLRYCVDAACFTTLRTLSFPDTSVPHILCSNSTPPQHPHHGFSLLAAGHRGRSLPRHR